MSYKYKLPPKSPAITPETLKAMGAGVDIYARKKFITTPANTEKSMNLENTIRYSLEDANFSFEDINNYIELLYIERNNNMGGEFSDTPLNEKEEDDFMKTASDMAQKGNLDYNEKQEKSNRKLGNTPMTDKERNMTPEEYREYREREKLEEQGRKNLTQEVLRRLRNH